MRWFRPTAKQLRKSTKRLTKSQRRALKEQQQRNHISTEAQRTASRERAAHVDQVWARLMNRQPDDTPKAPCTPIQSEPGSVETSQPVPPVLSSAQRRATRPASPIVAGPIKLSRVNGTEAERALRPPLRPPVKPAATTGLRSGIRVQEEHANTAGPQPQVPQATSPKRPATAWRYGVLGIEHSSETTA